MSTCLATAALISLSDRITKEPRAVLHATSSPFELQVRPSSRALATSSLVALT